MTIPVGRLLVENSSLELGRRVCFPIHETRASVKECYLLAIAVRHEAEKREASLQHEQVTFRQSELCQRSCSNKVLHDGLALSIRSGGEEGVIQFALCTCASLKGIVFPNWSLTRSK